MLAREAERLLILDQEIGARRLGITLDWDPSNQEGQCGDMNARNLTLHTFMAENPTFFVDVLCEIYLPANRDKDQDVEPSPQERARAQAAHRLLEGMDTIPGTAENGTLNEMKLMEWIEEVRKLAAERDRIGVADSKIGAILAHALVDPEDKAWPQMAVRGVIENLDAKDVECGLIFERYNMRGVYSKALYEGGAKERALADQYREWAACSRPRWPKLIAPPAFRLSMFGVNIAA